MGVKAKSYMDAPLPELKHAVPALDGRPKREPTIPHGIGFGYLWLLFLPENIPQSRHRFLGHQKINGHDACVVAFAQLPGRVRVPAQITLGLSAYPLLRGKRRTSMHTVVVSHP